MKPTNKIHFAIAQMNPTVGDLSGNAEKIIEWIAKADRSEADLIVFPEAALSGYPVWDLANRTDFVGAGLKHLEGIVRSTRGAHVQAVVGFIDKGRSVCGRSRNALAWISGGRILAKYYKRLLPTYDVFLEDIFFEPGVEGRVIPWKGVGVGPTICEDIWDEKYPQKPVKELRAQKAKLIVNISASPFYAGIHSVREKLLRNHASRYRMPFLYVNQVGAQDELIFDGRSLFVDARGRVLFRAPAFEEGLYHFEWDLRQDKFRALPSSKDLDPIPEIYHALVLGVRDYCRKNRFTRAVIGLSGGIDSALVAAVAADALGPAAVVGVAMPGEYSSKGSWEDAEELARRLKIQFRVNPIREAYAFMNGIYRDQKCVNGLKACETGEVSLALENLQARLRGLNLMFISNDEGRLLLSTGNKSELAMGYCTLYGDMAGGLCVLGDVLKTDVYRLARYRNGLGAVIPENTFEKPPSAELRPGQKDQDTLPPYDILDEILKLFIEENRSAKTIRQMMRRKGVPEKVVSEILHKVDHNEYKRRQAPPILRVTQKAWFGRRMPITNWYR